MCSVNIQSNILYVDVMFQERELDWVEQVVVGLQQQVRIEVKERKCSRK